MAITVTGFIALPGFTMPTSRLMPSNYFVISNPERLKWWYRILGIHYFRLLLLATVWGNPKKRKFYFDGTRSGFNNLIYQSKQSEFGHLIPLIMLLILAVFCVYKGFYVAALVATAINFIGNLLPIPLQRMHRYRIQRLQTIQEKRNRVT